MSNIACRQLRGNSYDSFIKLNDADDKEFLCPKRDRRKPLKLMEVPSGLSPGCQQYLQNFNSFGCFWPQKVHHNQLESC